MWITDEFQRRQASNIVFLIVHNVFETLIYFLLKFEFYFYYRNQYFMQKLSMCFVSLHEISSFSKDLNVGFLLNTANLTLTGRLPAEAIKRAINDYRATLIETTDEVYSYDHIN